MSAIAEPGPLELGPWWRKLRGPAAFVLVGIALAATAAIVGRPGNTTPFDPRNASPDGTRALAALLAQRGDRVTVQDRVSQLSAQRTNTVVLSNPAAVTDASLQTISSGQANLVLVAPDNRVLRALGIGATLDSAVAPGTVEPSCSLPSALVAGAAHVGGFAYRVVQPGAAACYPAAGDVSLVVASRPSGGRTVVIGSPDTLTNAHLGAEGDAALALGLLDNPTVQWAPGPLQALSGPGSRQGLLNLLPPRVLWATLQLSITVVVIALWRARRLGPLVAEPMPVVVRAAETVEGSGRLLHAARARGGAAAALRTATVTRLARRLRIATDAPPDAVTAAVVAKTDRAPAAVSQVLYGGAPSDDTALVQLGRELASLEIDVRRETRAGGQR